MNYSTWCYRLQGETKEFARLARKGGLSDQVLCEAVVRAEQGIVDAQLGRFLIKQRIAREGRGRSGGFRSVLFYQQSNRAIFLHLFAKNERDNLSSTEQEMYRQFARELAGLGDATVGTLVREQRWIEIDYEGYKKALSQPATEVPSPGRKGSPGRRRDR